jgi:phosphoribosylglycinamide formyltransferase-1
MNRIAIFASGSGTNAENIIRFFRPKENIEVAMVLCNRPGAKVIERAKNLNVDTLVFSKEELYNSDRILNSLRENRIDFLVLAGFLLLVPPGLISAYPDAIVNIHPALLPNYGGKGMYGSRVHEAVIENREKESGITIHYVNERYDDGNIIFQAKCPVAKDDTPESLAAKIHALEHEHYPKIIDKIIRQRGVEN